MAQRAEQKGGARLPEISGSRSYEAATVHGAPSVPAALEKIASATQRVVSKRIDLFLLENHELISGLLFKAGFIIFGTVLALAAWLTGLYALVIYLMPGWGTAPHLGVFAAVNAVIGGVVVALSLRQAPKLTSEIEEEHSRQEHDEERHGDDGEVRRESSALH